MKDSRSERIARIVAALDGIQQMRATRIGRILKPSGVPAAQFAVLARFAAAPERSWTVGQLAAVSETNQPGLTKVVQRLLGKGHLASWPDGSDRRVRHLTITADGLEAFARASAAMRPDLLAIFEDWKGKDLRAFASDLERLHEWLDSHRDTHIASNDSPANGP